MSDNLIDMFAASYDYESTANGGAAQFNGNIASMQWRTYINSICLPQQQYRFSYDVADRLTAAAHYTHNGTAWVFTNNYSESGITYDLNGNILNYLRRGMNTPGTFSKIDNLTYVYGDSNRPDRLTRVLDGGSATKGFVFVGTAPIPNYLYDNNGNLQEDKHKSMTFGYNYLNLPHTFTKTGAGAGTMTVTYTATGEKLTKTVGSNTKYYFSGIEYNGSTLEAIYHPEGRCTPNGASFYYEYTLTRQCPGQLPGQRHGGNILGRFPRLPLRYDDGRPERNADCPFK